MKKQRDGDCYKGETHKRCGEKEEKKVRIEKRPGKKRERRKKTTRTTSLRLSRLLVLLMLAVSD